MGVYHMPVQYGSYAHQPVLYSHLQGKKETPKIVEDGVGMPALMQPAITTR